MTSAKNCIQAPCGSDLSALKRNLPMACLTCIAISSEEHLALDSIQALTCSSETCVTVSQLGKICSSVRETSNSAEIQSLALMPQGGNLCALLRLRLASPTLRRYCSYSSLNLITSSPRTEIRLGGVIVDIPPLDIAGCCCSNSAEHSRVNFALCTKALCSVFTGLHSGMSCVAGCTAKVSGTKKVCPPHRDESFSLLFKLIENDPSP